MPARKKSEPAPESSESPEAFAGELAALLGIEDNDRRAYLLEELGRLASTSGSLQSVGVAGAPSDQLKAARSVESACERVLSAFAITDREFDLEAALAASPIAAILAFQIAEIIRPHRRYHSPVVDDESRAQVTAVLDSVVLLRDAACHAREQAEEQKGEGMGGHRRGEDRPLKETAWHILRLYIELTGRQPGVSSPPEGGQKGGPAVRFLERVLRWLGFQTRPSTAANLINELKQDPEFLRTEQPAIFKSEKS